MRHDSDSTSDRLRTHARKAKIGYPEGNGSRSYCSSIITMQIKRSARLTTRQHWHLPTHFPAQVRPKLILSGIFASLYYMRAKTPIKMRVISRKPHSSRDNPNLFIYNNIKSIDCQAFQSLQTLTKTPCEQKENFDFWQIYFSSKAIFMQVAKLASKAFKKGKLYLL